VFEQLEPRLALIVPQVCERIRGRIMANPRVHALGPAGTIPAFMIFSAVVIAKAALIAIPPLEDGETGPRQRQLNQAESELRSLSDMDPKAFAIAEPPSASSSVRYGGQPLLDF
ncbi:hypothetical protein JIN85_20635, partial [Luteolibacter pohnpeiensis]